VGSRRDCAWILDLSGFRVVTMDEAESRRLPIRIERRGVSPRRSDRYAICQLSSVQSSWRDEVIDDGIAIVPRRAGVNGC
jgi:hypothetical protein